MEEIFEQARFRVGRTVRMRKEAIEYYQQKHRQGSVNNSGDELMVDPAPERRISLEHTHPRQQKFNESGCDSALQSPKPDQNPLNLRQIDELSESESFSSDSGHSTKNSKYKLRASAQGSQIAADERASNAPSARGETVRDVSFKKKSFCENSDLLTALEKNGQEIARL